MTFFANISNIIYFLFKYKKTPKTIITMCNSKYSKLPLCTSVAIFHRQIVPRSALNLRQPRFKPLHLDSSVNMHVRACGIK